VTGTLDTDPGALGTILAVFAHPDDEAYLAAGIMMEALARGERVACVTATRGELGVTDPDRWPPDQLGEIREREMKACLATLGVTEHHWLGLPDGGCADVRHDDAVAAVMAVADDVRPDTILTFPPDGLTLHPDHSAASRWATDAGRRLGCRVLWAAKTHAWVDEFMELIDPDDVMMVEGARPPSVDPEALSFAYRLPDDRLERKVQALLCQESQIAVLVEQWGDAAFVALNRDETYRDAE
jgi:LmbE family N-acetylglucosaminyl deacetylase